MSWIRLLRAGWLSGAIFLVAGCATVPQLEPIPEAVEWGATPDVARHQYATAMEYLSKGRQADAERVVMEAFESAPVDNQRMWFLRGVLESSRNQFQAARASFAEEYALGKQGLLSRAADIMVPMQMNLRVKVGFEELKTLIELAPDEPLIRWLYAMQCVQQGTESEAGAAEFATLLTTWEVGPVMLHNSYAQLLSRDLNRPEEALAHRVLAAEMEPEPDMYQGLAITLRSLQRYDEANEVYAKLLELCPEQSLYWIQWGNCLFYQGHYVAASGKYEQGVLRDPHEVGGLLFWGRCLEKEGQLAEGFGKYTQALKRNPSSQQARAYIAHSQLYGYGTEPNIERALITLADSGDSAVDALRQRVLSADESVNPLAPEKSAVLLAHLLALGNQDHPAAQYNLGMIYRYGIGVPMDAAAGDAWIKRAAENGHRIAQRILNPPLRAEHWN